MLRRITLSNFMSHVHTVLDLAPGLTVLIGPNNCGKSAVVSALEALCQNTASDFMVRHGAREAEVTVETDEGHRITWKRSKSSASYEINGRVIHRLGRQVPEDLQEKLRLPLVQAEQEGPDFDVHLAYQKEPLFLLEQSPARRATFFASSSDAGRMLQMQQLHRTQVQEAKKQRARTERELVRLQEQIRVLEPIAQLANRIDEAETLAVSIEKAAHEIVALQAWTSATQEALNLGKQASDRSTTLSTLKSPPALPDTAPLVALLDSLERAEQSLEQKKEQAVALHLLHSPPEIVSTAALDRWVASYDLLLRVRQSESSWEQLLSGLQDPPPLLPVEALEQHTEQVAEAQHRCSRFKLQNETLRALQAPPVLQEDQKLQGLLCDRLEPLGRQLALGLELERTLSPLEAPPELTELSALQNLIEQWEESSQEASRRNAMQELLEQTTLFPELEEEAPLVEVVEGLRTAEAECRKSLEEVGKIARQCQQVEEQIRAWAATHPTCPLCGAPTDAERLLTQGHHHE